MKTDAQVRSAADHTDASRGCHRAKGTAHGAFGAASRASQWALLAALGACSRAPRVAPHPIEVAALPAAPLAPTPMRFAIADASLPAPFQTTSANNPAPRALRPIGTLPQAVAGLRVTQWAKGFEFARAMTLAPDGAVLVSEANAGTILALRDADHDGAADREREVFASDLDLPFGLVLHPTGWLYVGCTSRLVRFRVARGEHLPQGDPELVLALPGNGYHQHWTRSVAVSADGARVFVGVGSETNVDVEPDPRRAAVTVAAIDGAGARTFATGLRNPVGLAVHPMTGALFAVVNERDELGDDLAPDYLTEVHDGAFYGWPFSYWGGHEDPRRAGERPDLVARAVVPDLSLGAHTAPVAIAFPVRDGVGVPRGDALVSLHGSWNRSTRVGYKVVRVHFRDGRPTGEVTDWLGGLLSPRGVAWGRPAGLLELPDGSILVLDDGAQTIWRVARVAP